MRNEFSIGHALPMSEVVDSSTRRLEATSEEDIATMRARVSKISSPSVRDPACGSALILKLVGLDMSRPLEHVGRGRAPGRARTEDLGRWRGPNIPQRPSALPRPPKNALPPSRGELPSSELKAVNDDVSPVTAFSSEHDRSYSCHLSTYATQCLTCMDRSGRNSLHASATG